LDKDIVKKVLGTRTPLSHDTPPSSLVTTTYDEIAAEAGDLAQSEEDVLMWALFPNEARTYLSKHRTSEKTAFMLEEESAATKEEQVVDMNQIRDLIRVVEETGIGEVTVEEAGSKITVRSQAVLGQAQLVAAATDGLAGAANGGAVASVGVGDGTNDAAGARAASPQASDEPARPLSWVAVIAPMVGTFYAAPAPDKPPYVQVGDEVVANQALCIVEAMKLMNEISAEQMGIVREICVENAQPVEFGTVLFYLEPVCDQPVTTLEDTVA
jgi:oxaloacetate decarboxylase alpha subunit